MLPRWLRKPSSVVANTRLHTTYAYQHQRKTMATGLKKTNFYRNFLSKIYKIFHTFHARFGNSSSLWCTYWYIQLRNWCCKSRSSQSHTKHDWFQHINECYACTLMAFASKSIWMWYLDINSSWKQCQTQLKSSSIRSENSKLM